LIAFDEADLTPSLPTSPDEVEMKSTLGCSQSLVNEIGHENGSLCGKYGTGTLLKK